MVHMKLPWLWQEGIMARSTTWEAVCENEFSKMDSIVPEDPQQTRLKSAGVFPIMLPQPTSVIATGLCMLIGASGGFEIGSAGMYSKVNGIGDPSTGNPFVLAEILPTALPLCKTTLLN
jgi:hypothetical protein